MAGRFGIGELAAATSVSRDTIRYYERLNLHPRAPRSSGGYRIYYEADVERLHFVRQAQSLGLSLDEIKALLPGMRAGLGECRRVRDILSSKLEQCDARIAEMQTFRGRLAAYLKECEATLEGKREPCCPVISEIKSGPRQRAASNGSSRGGGVSRARVRKSGKV